MHSSTRSRLVFFSLLSIAPLALGGCSDSTVSSDDTNGPGSDGISGDGDTNETGDAGDGDGDAGDGDGDAGDGDGDTNDDDGGGMGPKFDIFTTPDGGGDCGDGGDNNDATLTGTVFAPNGTIPVVGALVYTTGSPPEGIPDQVYCA